ncbi:MaoC-like dehydratase [Acrocarpospora pleiomorpha]|uniref:MaoC-like dehydratase n=1 Tax=Acrocarpospora pleiomorpha TaxID=90975 RepID=A0A5M3XA99_9ACTN|nr:MaoC/PaaZ C-terminal domain-containing protein [Acrocarpospora pleiomorpha]GES17119.1 MaoC-like dehydratase [Acrocarpospora pleiomorpha]
MTKPETAARMAPGHPVPPASVHRVGPLTRTDFVRYAGAGGDFNPIHHDETFARAAGYPAVFGHGLLTAGILGGYAASWLGRRNLRRFSVRYVDQVWPGDTLVLSGEVLGCQSAPDGGTEVEVGLLVHSEAEGRQPRLVLRGGATAVYASAPAGARP